MTLRTSGVARLGAPSSWRKRLVIACVSMAAALLYWSPAFVYLELTGFGDWQQFQHQWEATYVAATRFGEFPFWNPWHCGGTLLWGDPQAQGFGPIYWAVVIPFGTVLGAKIFMVLHAAAGFSGMFVASQRFLGVGTSGAVAGAILWAGSGFFAWHGSGGHSAFLPFYFAPWVLLAWRRASVDLRYAVAVAWLLALTLWEGGVYPFPYFCLLLVFDSVVRMCVGESNLRVPIRELRWNIVRAGLVAVPLAALLGAWRLVPILVTMSRYPRPTRETVALDFSDVLAMLTSKEYDYGFPGHNYVWAEFGTFIGHLALGLAMLGSIVAWRKNHRFVLVGTVLFGLTMMGWVSDLHPWPLLHHLPVFDSLRVPSRFAVLTTLYLGFAAALGVDWLHRRASMARVPRALRGVVELALLVAMAANLYWGNVEVIDRWRHEPPPSSPTPAAYYIVPPYRRGGVAALPSYGLSTRECYTGMEYLAAPGLWVGRVPQARVENGRLIAVARTANTITLDVETGRDAHVVVNQTWAVGWTSDIGTAVRGRSGLIEISGIPAGTRRLTMRFFPTEFPFTALLTAFGAIGSVLVMYTPRRSRRTVATR